MFWEQYRHPEKINIKIENTDEDFERIKRKKGSNFMCEDYQELIDRISKEWESIHPADEEPEMKWFDLCKEINLWTYWQGRGVKNVDILVVGQDWGNPFQDKKTTRMLIDNISKINSGELEANCLYGIKSPYATDRNLRYLFQELKCGEDVLYPDIIENRYNNLFFTNFCLGYRKGKESGGMTKEVMMRDSQYFRELVEILKPKIVICLGKDTFECVWQTMTGEEINISSTDYWNMLNRFENRKILQDGMIIYGMGHCGSFGININRKKYDQNEFPELATCSGKALMKRDWQVVNKDIEKLKIRAEILK